MAEKSTRQSHRALRFLNLYLDTLSFRLWGELRSIGWYEPDVSLEELE